MDKGIFSFGIKEQLMITLQNVSEVNRERSHLTAASSVYDSTKHNVLVTVKNNELNFAQVNAVIKSLSLDESAPKEKHVRTLVSKFTSLFTVMI